MVDAAPIQVLANGTCNGAHAALVTVATGATVSSPGPAAGTYLITLDPGLIGDNADANHLRVMIQIIGGAVNANVNAVVKAFAAGVMTVAFTTQVGAGAPADEAFDFIIWKDLGN